MLPGGALDLALALAWVADVVPGGARVVACKRLVGGISSAVHGISLVDAVGQRTELVLRRWDTAEGAELVRREALTLDRLASTNLPVPRLVALDEVGHATGGRPAILMTHLPGHIHLNPRDPDAWLRQMAFTLHDIHASTIDAPRYEVDLEPRRLKVPTWSAHPAYWARALELVTEVPPIANRCLVHGDYQHFNLLWSRERLTGLVD